MAPLAILRFTKSLVPGSRSAPQLFRSNQLNVPAPPSQLTVPPTVNDKPMPVEVYVGMTVAVLTTLLNVPLSDAPSSNNA